MSLPTESGIAAGDAAALVRKKSVKYVCNGCKAWSCRCEIASLSVRSAEEGSSDEKVDVPAVPLEERMNHFKEMLYERQVG